MLPINKFIAASLAGDAEYTGGGGGGVIAIGPSLDHIHDNSDMPSGDSTWTGVNLGTADPDRKIFLLINWRMIGGINSITIGGVSATQHVALASSNPLFQSEIWSADVPEGATGDIVVNVVGTSDGNRWFSADVYSVLGAKDELVATGSVNGATTLSTTESVPEGAAILATSCSNPSGGSVASWAASDLTEDYERVTPAGADTETGASATELTAGSKTIAVTHIGGTNIYCTMVYVVLEPEPVAASIYDTDAEDYFTRAEALDANAFDQTAIDPIYTAEYIKGKINKYVIDLKAVGLWTKLTELYLLSGVTFGAILAKLKYDTVATLTNSGFVAGDYVAVGSGGGLTGDGSSHLEAGFTDDLADDFGSSVYVPSWNGEIFCYTFAVQDSGSNSNRVGIGNRSSTLVRFYCDAGYDGPEDNTGGVGLFTGSRSSGFAQLYLNGSFSQQTTEGVRTPTGNEFALFCLGNGPDSFVGPRGHRMSFVAYHSNLTGTEAALFSTITNNLMKALGCAVYETTDTYEYPETNLYIDKVNAERAAQSIAPLTVEAEEIIDDCVHLLKGEAAPHGRVTGQTAVDVWDDIQHLVMFRGAGNVRAGNKICSLVGADGTAYNNAPWDSAYNGSNQYSEFAYDLPTVALSVVYLGPGLPGDIGHAPYLGWSQGDSNRKVTTSSSPQRWRVQIDGLQLLTAENEITEWGWIAWDALNTETARIKADGSSLKTQSSGATADAGDFSDFTTMWHGRERAYLSPVTPKAHCVLDRYLTETEGDNIASILLATYTALEALSATPAYLAHEYNGEIDVARADEGVPLLSTEAAEINEDAIALLNGQAAPNGRIATKAFVSAGFARDGAYSDDVQFDAESILIKDDISGFSRKSFINLTGDGSGDGTLRLVRSTTTSSEQWQIQVEVATTVTYLDPATTTWDTLDAQTWTVVAAAAPYNYGADGDVVEIPLTNIPAGACVIQIRAISQSGGSGALWLEKDTPEFWLNGIPQNGIDIWSNIKHLVNFRGAGNVGSGTAVIALKGENGSMMSGHPWDARGDGSNDYILFPSLTVGHNHSFLLNALAPTIGSYNAMWVLNPASGYAIDSLDGLAIAKAGSTSDVIGAYHDGTAGAAKFATSLNHSGESELAYTLTLDGGTGSIFEENSGAANSDTYTNSADIVPINMTYNCRMLNGSSPVNYLNSRPHVGLIVEQALDATQRAAVHAILKGWYDALAALWQPFAGPYDFASGISPWNSQCVGSSYATATDGELEIYQDSSNSAAQVILLEKYLSTTQEMRVTYKARSPDNAALRWSDNGGGGFSVVSGSSYQALSATQGDYEFIAVEANSSKQLKAYLSNQSDKAVFLDDISIEYREPQ
jgi:hypothetical protein